MAGIWCSEERRKWSVWTVNQTRFPRGKGSSGWHLGKPGRGWRALQSLGMSKGPVSGKKRKRAHVDSTLQFTKPSYGPSLLGAHSSPAREMCQAHSAEGRAEAQRGEPMCLRPQEQSPGLPILALVSAWISTALPLRPHPRPPQGTKGWPACLPVCSPTPSEPWSVPFCF